MGLWSTFGAGSRSHPQAVLEQNTKVYLAARDGSKAALVIAKSKASTNKEIGVLKLNLAELAQVKSLVEES